MRPILALLALLFLSACQSTPPATTGPSGVPVADMRAICPTPKDYSLAEQQALAKALRGLPKDSPIPGFIGDYDRLLHASRACLANAH